MREKGLGRVTQPFEGRRQEAFGGLGAYTRVQTRVRVIGGRHGRAWT
jgi:hypothetical protein